MGSQGLEVSAEGLGCMGMTYAYGAGDEAGGIATIHRALELGITFLDTAEVYGPVHQRGAGRARRRRAPRRGRDRDQVRLRLRGPDLPSAASTVRPQNAARVCEESLRRLGTDHIDLYYQHRVDPDVPIEETVGAMGELVEAGKVRYIGLSEAAPETIRRAHATFPLTAVQSEYSLWTRDPEDEVLPTLRELGIGFVPYSPLGRGFLTGQIRSLDDLDEDDWRRTNPRFQGEAFAENLRLADRVAELAEGIGATPAQVALAWVLAKGEDLVPIPGTKSPTRLEENAAAADLELSAAEVAELDAAISPDAVRGSRYDDSGMTLLNG